MGVLLYADDPHGIEIDDRTLAHLKVVILGRLRRQECFTLSWIRAASTGSGRETIWLAPGIPLRFRLDDADGRPLNREWLNQLSATADRGDLRIIPEPEVTIAG